jgi:hypothetical protein
MREGELERLDDASLIAIVANRLGQERYQPAEGQLEIGDFGGLILH